MLPEHKNKACQLMYSWTHNTFIRPAHTHTHTQRPSANCRSETEWPVRDYAQINQSIVTLHHIGAVCDSESERRSCNL